MHCFIFHSSRSLYESSYYVATNKTFARKWAAVEVITHQKFSTYSDVWSFGRFHLEFFFIDFLPGVTLWEMLEFGKVPFGALSNAESAQLIIEGERYGGFDFTDIFRLPKPETCPDSLYALMQSTWLEDAHSRPDFERILETLESIAEAIELEYQPTDSSSLTVDSIKQVVHAKKLDTIDSRAISIGQKVGRGFFGSVYKAKYMGKEVAMRKISKSSFGSFDQLQACIDELEQMR